MTIPAKDVRERFRRFLDESSADKLFIQTIDSPCKKTGFCGCDRGGAGWIFFVLKAALLELTLKLPVNGWKVCLLRRMGAKIGRDVYISPGVWIDPNYTRLLTIEDGVMIGMEARLMLHEFRRREFRAGRIALHKGCLIGAFSIIGPGVEIGEEATVAAGSVVGRDVAAGRTVGGNPARIIPLT